MLISCVLMDSMCNIRQVNHSGFSSVIKLQTYVTEWQKGVEMRLPVLTLELPVWFSICRTPIMAPRLKNHSLDLVCPSVPYWDSNSRVSQTAGSRCWGSSCGDGFVLIFSYVRPYSMTRWHSRRRHLAVCRKPDAGTTYHAASQVKGHFPLGADLLPQQCTAFICLFRSSLVYRVAWRCWCGSLESIGWCYCPRGLFSLLLTILNYSINHRLAAFHRKQRMSDLTTVPLKPCGKNIA